MKKRYLLLPALILLQACASLKEQRLTKQWQREKENFHIYLLMGQSNMAGRDSIHKADTAIHPKIFMLNQDTQWVLARHPLHFDFPKSAGAGPGLSFAKVMISQDPKVRIGLIPCAKGGSSIVQWVKGGYHSGSKSYPFDEALARIRVGAEEGMLKGVLWHQGEADCSTKEEIAQYKSRFTQFKQALEEELGTEDLPFVIGELGSFLSSRKPHTPAFNEMLREISESNECIGLVRSQDLSHKGDSLHFSAVSADSLGFRYAKEMRRVQTACKKVRYSSIN